MKVRSNIFKILFLLLLSEMILAQAPMILKFKTNNPGFSCPSCVFLYADNASNYSVDWNNDGVYEQTGITGNVTHDFGAPGIYTIRIQGFFPYVYFSSTIFNDQLKLIEFIQWGVTGPISLASFDGCENLVYTAIDNPDFAPLTDLNRLFQGCSAVNGNITNWNTTNIISMQSMFAGVDGFNQPIGNWNTSNVTDMNGMFGGTSFNQPLANWNTSNVTDMSYMFLNTPFNQPIGNWNVGQVTEMWSMFKGATNFNQPIGNWNVGQVLYMHSMFDNCTSFNQPLSNWNVSNVKAFQWMFRNATSFNQPIGNWNVSSGGDTFNNPWSFVEMFLNAISFNQNIGNWQLPLHPLTFDMPGMFNNCGLDCSNYSNTLIGWAAQTSISSAGVHLGALGIEYGDNAVSARNYLINVKGWQISGDVYIGNQALYDFYTSTNGQNWTNTLANNRRWLSNCDPCGLEPGNSPWYGLTCNSAGEVTKITLENNNLTGRLPASLSGLTKLKELRIRNNVVKGPINNNIFNGLNDFDYLDLGQNDFGSHFQNPFPPVFPPLPSFPNSTLFKYLYLDNNGFLSAIPPSYGDYNDLLVLNLSHNIIVGDIPVSLGNYPNLLNLSLNNNQLTGPIPSTFGNLAPHIGVLRLQENNLSGCFDDNLHSLCTIPTILQSHINPGNSFDMEWDDFCDLNSTNCVQEDVSNLISFYNATNGANWTNKSGWEAGAAGTNCDPCGLICGNDVWYGLTCNLNGRVLEINLPGNNLTGSLPSTLQDINFLTLLNLQNNEIGGNLPNYLGEEYIINLNLSNNNFQNSIPSSYSSITFLALNHNQLTGSIPNSFGTSTTLDYIFLNDNDLCGCYDPSLDALCTSTNNASNLTISNGNNFNAPWEEFCNDQIGECGGLLNNCTHPDFDALAALYFGTGGLSNLWTNSSGWSGILSGNCDPCGECGNNNPWFGITCLNNRVIGINLQTNNLIGTIPSSISQLTELQTLNLRDNALNGSIPVEIGDLDLLTTLDLGKNDLTGSLPPELCNLMPGLTSLIVHDNDLSGCYDAALTCFCTLPNLNSNISALNEFPIPFATFCATGDGTCTDNCMDFDGVNDDLERLGLSTNGNFTLMAWFKADVVPNGGAEDRIFSFGPTTRLEIGIHHTTGNLWVHDALYGTYTTNNFVRDGNWHHVGFTRNGTQRNIYLDGALVETNIASTSTANYGPNFRVGNWTGGGTTALFKGQIDEVAFWNYPMTSSDIQSIACDITGLETGLIAFYDFNLGVSGANNTSVTAIPDQSGNGNNLTINNMAMNGAISNLLISGAGINSACATCFVLPTQGAISGAQTVCLNGNPAAFNNTSAGTVSGGATLSYRWESSIGPFSTWNIIVNATGLTYDPPSGLTETTHYRRVTIGTLNSTSCESSPTNVIIVTVQNTPTPGAISGDQTICSGADPAQIDNTTVGTVSGGATLSYRWESSVSPFSTWNTIVGATGLDYDPPSGLTETTHYRRVTVGTLNSTSCESSPTNIVIVTIVSAPPIANCNTGFTSTIVASVGFVDITTAQINNSSSSACNSNLTFSFHPTNSETTLTYNCNQTGEKNVTLYVTDANGLQSSCPSTYEIEFADPTLIALREIYESTGGANWTNTTANNRPWFEDCDPCGLIDGVEWFGIDCKFNTTLDNIVIDKLYLQNNNLDGILPDVFDVFEEITWLNLFGNPNLNGNIPPSFCEMTSLQIIQMGNTGIGLDTYGNELPAPTIPTGCFLDFNQLSILGTAHNTGGHFKGTLPEFSPLAPISNLYFDHNQYSGDIPESYCFLNFAPGTTLRLNNNPNLTGCYDPCFYRYCTGFPNFTNAEISTNTGLPSWSDFCSGIACCVPSLTIDWTPIFTGTYLSSGNIEFASPGTYSLNPNANVIFSHGVGSSVTIPISLNTYVGNNILIQANGCN